MVWTETNPKHFYNIMPNWVRVKATYGWSTVLLAVIIQHSSIIKDKEPPFPVASQIRRTLWEIALPNSLNLKISTHFWTSHAFTECTPSYKHESKSSKSTRMCYLSLWSWLHDGFNHLMWTSTNCLYSITIRGISHPVWRPPTFPVNLPFELLHPLDKSSLLVVRPFSWLLCVSKNLQKEIPWCVKTNICYQEKASRHMQLCKRTCI